MNNTKDIDLFLTLHPHGWSTCWLYVEKEVYQLIISHVFGDPLEDFILALSKILEGQKEVNWCWYAEPEGTKITLQAAAQNLVVVVQSFQESYEEEIKTTDPIVDFEISTKAFLTLAYFQLKKIEQLLKQPSFATHRNGKFPFRTFKHFEAAAKIYLELI